MSMKKKTLNKQSSTPSLEQANSVTTLKRLKHTDIDDDFSWRQRPKSDAYIEEKARELEEWVLDEKDNRHPWSIRNFCREKHIKRRNLATWAECNEVFREAYAFALEVIGTRRYDATFEKQTDRVLFFLNQGRYDDEFDEDFKKYNEIVKVANTNTTITNADVTVKD